MKHHNNYVYKDRMLRLNYSLQLPLMNLRKRLPKRVIVIEVPINNHRDNAKAITQLIQATKIDEKRNILIIGNDKIKYLRVKTKWFW